MNFAGALSWGVSWNFTVWPCESNRSQTFIKWLPGSQEWQLELLVFEPPWWSVTNLPSPELHHAGGRGWLQQGTALRHPFGKNVLCCTWRRKRKRIQILEAQGQIIAWHIECMWPNLMEVLTGLSSRPQLGTQTGGRGFLSAGAPHGHHHLTYLLFIICKIYYSYCLRHAFVFAMSLIIKKRHIFVVILRANSCLFLSLQLKKQSPPCEPHCPPSPASRAQSHAVLTPPVTAAEWLKHWNLVEWELLHQTPASLLLSLQSSQDPHPGTDKANLINRHFSCFY